jgi:diguanylate cyclase (GGDEF)-like protein
MSNSECGKIMVVDDEVINRDMLNGILTAEGYDVFGAVNGEHALSMIPDYEPDLILLDVVMPIMDGFEITKKLKSDPIYQHIPIVLLTSLNKQDSRIKGLEAGAEDFVCKPFDRHELLARVRNLVRLKHLSDFLKNNNRILDEYDMLTGLPNRKSFQKQLKQSLICAARDRATLGLIIVDIINFKNISDTLGSTLAELAIKGISERMNKVLNNEVFISRLGDCNFALIVPNAKANIMVYSDKIHEVMSHPFLLSEKEVFVTARQGGALYPESATNWENLLKNAESAVHQSMNTDPKTLYIYQPELGARLQHRINLENSLRYALPRQELFLNYQPQVDLRSGKIIGLEALLRWQHPEFGLIPPDEFISLAEESGLIFAIGEWVLRTACTQNKTWQEAGLTPVTIAVNVSPYQFNDKKLIMQVNQALAASGLKPEYLELELTESVMLDNPEIALSTIHELRTMGVKISIDDFGTGYSSLSYLKSIEANRIKIDRSFIEDIIMNPDDAVIVLSIIAMAHQMGRQVIAEGVENEEQMYYLLHHHCDEIQGYFFSRPVPANEVESFLAKKRQFFIDSDVVNNQKNTILVVENDADVVKSLQLALKKYNYEILTADKSKRAFELLAKNNVQVILYNQTKPGIAAPDFLEKVKELHPDVVRITLNSYHDIRGISNLTDTNDVYKFMLNTSHYDHLISNIKEAFKHHDLNDENIRLKSDLQRYHKEL